MNDKAQDQMADSAANIRVHTAHHRRTDNMTISNLEICLILNIWHSTM